MGYVYSPGLTVAARTVVRKVRRLPIRGHVLVTVGQPVAATDIVAEASLPGEVRPMNVAGVLGLEPADVPAAMLKAEGDSVVAGETIARTRGLWGRFRSECRAPLAGTIESVSATTGQILIRGPAGALRKTAFAAGRIVAVEPDESATVEVQGTLVQGIFGLGGEACGPLTVVARTPADVLDADRIEASHAGRVLVGGSLVTAAAVRHAAARGVAGIVAGGLDDTDLRELLGYELGVAITGDEALGLTLVITEGFGRIDMAQRTFELLGSCAGRLASISGATQIRAGVVRPEVLIPTDVAGPAETSGAAGGTLTVGAALRAVRAPHFGRSGRCTALPAEPARLASEAVARVVEIEFEDQTRALVPRANVELIEQ